MTTTTPSRITWQDGRTWAILAALLSLALFVSTLQWQINGSQSPYATDVGEIQNALPRWGTIHFTGYPLYTLLGSMFVSLLRVMGIAPAAGASLFSAFWAALAIGWLTLLLIDLGIWKAGAAACALLFALSGSLWIDASLAEIHTLTLFLTVGSLHLGLRYARLGNRRDLLWLVMVFTQGVAHQRAIAFVAPTLLILVWPRWRDMLRAWKPIVGLALLAPLVYLYLPLREWMGATWTFNAPGSWRGFWSMIMDTKAGRIIALPATLGELIQRLRLLTKLLHGDLALPVLVIGGLGLLLPLGQHRRREAFAWLVGLAIHLILCLLIWEGRVSDALLAAKLPVVLFAVMGLGYLAKLAASPLMARVGFMVLLLLMGYYTYDFQRPQVLAITRDPSSEAVIAAVERLPRSAKVDTVIWTLWGHDYWALRYAQTYRGQLNDLTLVDHNAPPQEIVSQGAQLVTLRKTFYVRPVAWWEERLGPIHMHMAAADMIAITPLTNQPLLDEQTMLSSGNPPLLDLGNGIQIASASVSRPAESVIDVAILWQASRVPDDDYAVAVHLLAQDPPTGPEHILAQADQQHPVSGLYPLTRWRQGEQVRDLYRLDAPASDAPVAVRIGMYRQLADGQFENTAWLTLPLLP